jgi:hypothetical protein
LLHDRFAGQTGTAWTVVHREEHFRCHDDVVSAGELFERSADGLLGGAGVVAVGGVPEVDAEIEGLPEERRRIVVRDGPAFAALSEAHGAHGDPADLEA